MITGLDLILVLVGAAPLVGVGAAMALIAPRKAEVR